MLSTVGSLGDMMMGKASLLIALVFCLGAHLASAKTIKNTELGFTLELPPGARYFPEGMQGTDIIHSYILKHPVRDGELLAFTIARMRGTIGRERITEKQLKGGGDKLRDHPMLKALPPDARFDLIDEKWSGFDIQVMRMRMTAEGVSLVAYIAQVPLRREAIQIAVGCGQDNADDGRRLLRTLLAHLEGRSNWTRDGGELPTGQLTESESWRRMISSLLRVVAVVVVALLVTRYLVKRSREKKAERDAMARLFPPSGPGPPGPPPQY